MKRYVLGFAFNEDSSRVVLISKLKPKWQVGLLNGIGGKIEEGETPLQAMVREFEEETGITVGVSASAYANSISSPVLNLWRHFATMSGPGWECLCFSTRLPVLEDVRSIEEEQVGVYSTNPLPKSCMSNLCWLLAIESDLDLKDRVLEIRYP